MAVLPLPERGLKLGKPRKIWLALGIFAVAITASALGYVPIAVALIAALVAFRTEIMGMFNRAGTEINTNT